MKCGDVLEHWRADSEACHLRRGHSGRHKSPEGAEWSDVECNTSVCVRCLKRKATHHTGHVMKGRRKLAAGWCSRCLKVPGFVGHWRSEMNPGSAS